MTQVAAQSSTAVAELPVMVQGETGKAVGKVASMPVRDAQQAEESAPRGFSSKERDGILKQLNKTLEAFDTHVSLSFDEKSRQTIIKVIDSDTGKVVRQIPNEQLLRISERITELLGVIYDEKM